ncbi:hypothetical protein [Microbacterium sp.]|uniref:hypothetical protein n=1 Tax=Microbacterium sp. TaxID=51671 RepID=UPI003A9541DC
MFAIITVLNWPATWDWSMSCICIAATTLLFSAGIADAFNLTSSGRRVSPTRLVILEIQDAGGTAAAFAATYLFPFLGIDLSDLRSVIAYLLFFGVLLVISVRSPMGLVSPTLYLLGWRIFLIDLSGYSKSNQQILISRSTPTVGSQLLLRISGGFRTAAKGTT